ncbi:hypothetical protein ACLB2K_000552 [Fragaria x ananassa]
MSRHSRRRRSESSDSDESHGCHHRRKRRMSAEEEDRMIAEYLAEKAEKKKKTETFVWKKTIETRTPIYRIEKDEGVDNTNNNTCIIRFSVGPPYEDIAFRIVNKDWELSHKKGFKCTFERGILQLYFNFKRYRYRR